MADHPVDTGLNSPIGERLRRVRRFVEDEPMFLANYADVLTNAQLPDMIERFEASGAIASLLAVPPESSHHVVDIDPTGLITQVIPMQDLRQWENGGYFVLRPKIFDYLNEGEDLVEDAIMRLVPLGRVLAYPYKGYSSPADTVKERAQLRGDVSPRYLPVDDLGSGSVGHDPAARCRVARAGEPGLVVVRLHAPVIRPCCRCTCAPRADRCLCSRSARPDGNSRSPARGAETQRHLFCVKSLILG